MREIDFLSNKINEKIRTGIKNYGFKNKLDVEFWLESEYTHIEKMAMIEVYGKLELDKTYSKTSLT